MEPNCRAESTAVADAKARLLARGAGDWHEVGATYARVSTVRGGGREWTLRCHVRVEGVEGGRLLSSITLWSGDPEATVPSERRPPSPALLKFVAQTQRRLRAMGLAGRFRPDMGEHWPGHFSRWGTGVAAVDRVLASIKRLERRMGAVPR